MSRPTGAATYRAVLRLPGAPRAFAAAILGRLSYAILPVAVLLSIQSATGSYAAAGASSGLFGLVAALMPLKSRLIGRFGQRRVIPVLSAGFAASSLGLAALIATGVEHAGPYVALTGLLGLGAPPLGPSMRALWAALTPQTDLRQRAYGLDTTVESVLFTVGPVIAAALITVGGGTSALVVLAALNLGGSLGLATSPAAAAHAAARPPTPDSPSGLLGPLRDRGFAVLAAVMLGLGLGYGPVDLAVIARAGDAGRPEVSGLLLGVFAVGGAVGGLLWARLPHRRPVSTQLGALFAVAGIGLAVTAATPNLALLGAALALTGLVDGPTFIVAYLASDSLVAEQHRTEASTWVNTATNTGLSVGAAAAGVLIDRFGATTALLVAAGLLLVAGGGTAAIRSRLDRQPAGPDDPA